MSILKKLFYISLILSITIFQACERLNMYDIASGKSRTAYAIAWDGTYYTLIIYNLYYEKQFTVNPSFPYTPEGISVNDKKNIIAYSSTSNYTSFAQPDLTNWITFTSTAPAINTIGVNENFIYFSGTDLFHFNEATSAWESYMPASTTSVDILQGYDGEIYLFDDDGTNYFNFYHIEESNLNIITTVPRIPPTGIFVSGFKTKNYIYIAFAGSTNSLFLISSGTTINLNPITSIGNSLKDIAVTEDDSIFIISNEGGSYFKLKQVLSPDTYVERLDIGNATNCSIESLDNNNIIIATQGATPNYNGLLIYNINDNRVKQVTSTNVVAMYVLR